MCANFFFSLTSSRIARSRGPFSHLDDNRPPSPARDFIIGDLTEDVMMSTGAKYGRRHNQMILFASGSFLSSVFTAYMSVIIVAMTDPTASSNRKTATYNWKDKNLILSAFFWGYCLAQLFASRLTKTRVGPKWILIGAVGISSLIGYLIPAVAAGAGSAGILVCRFLQGLALGFHGSCISMLYSKWIPPKEGSTLSGYIYSGSTAGIVCSMFLSGQISGTKQGWPLVMNIWSTAGVVWCITFSVFGCESPEEHSTISLEEKMYIQENIPRYNPMNRKVPWRHILTSVSFWALVLAECGVTYGHFLLLTEIANYLKYILKMDIQSNGILCALPYVWAILFMCILGRVTNFLIRKRVFSKGGTRKIMTAFGFIIPGITFLVLSYSGPESATTAIIWLALGIGIDMAANMNGILMNYTDLAPNHSSTLRSISNHFSEPFSLLGPLTVHFIVSEETNIREWRTVFLICMCFKVVTGIIFLLFGSGEIQSWNEETQRILPDNGNDGYRSNNGNNNEEEQL